MLHQPSWRFWAEVDANSQDEGRNESRSELKAPCDSSGILDNDIGAEAQEDTSNDPELPEHDKRATDASRCHLCGIDRDSSVLRTDTDAHDEACGEELLP